MCGQLSYIVYWLFIVPVSISGVWHVFEWYGGATYSKFIPACLLNKYGNNNVLMWTCGDYETSGAGNWSF
jgi:hypothetical protein